MFQLAVSGEKSNIAGVGFDLIEPTQVYESITIWRRLGLSGYVTLSNPRDVLACHRDPQVRSALRGAALVLPDGVGITLAARLLRLRHRGRVTGPGLMLQLCDWGRERGLRHYFYGGA